MRPSTAWLAGSDKAIHAIRECISLLVVHHSSPLGCIRRGGPPRRFGGVFRGGYEGAGVGVRLLECPR